MMRIKLESLLYYKRSIPSLAMQTCLVKRISFATGNQQVLSPTDKQQLLKIWTNLKLTTFHEKARFTVLLGANQRVVSITPIQEYSDLQAKYNSHLIFKFWEWLLRVMYQDFKRLVLQEEYTTKVYSTTWPTNITFKSVKTYFHDTLEEIKVWDMHKKIELHESKLK